MTGLLFLASMFFFLLFVGCASRAVSQKEYGAAVMFILLSLGSGMVSSVCIGIHLIEMLHLY